MSDPLAPSDTAASTPDGASSSVAVAAAIVAVPVLLAGCGGGGGGGESSGAGTTLAITAIEIRAESDSAGSVITVGDQAQPLAAGVVFQLNGKPTDLTGTKRAADPGHGKAAQSYGFQVHAAAGTTDKLVTVTINPSPATMSGVTTATSFALARHLSARVGFGGSWDDLLAVMGVPYATVINDMVEHARLTPVQKPPGWIDAKILSWQEFSRLTKAEQDAYNDSKWKRRQKLKEWWLQEIVKTSSPFTERMVLFWGNHFVVNVDDIEEPQLAWRWLSFLRANACGNFRSFVKAMAKMPAMVMYLNSDSNVVGNPNENFARELMELFTFGEGHVYTEADVPQVARAFTGYSVDDHKEWIYNAANHDPAADMVILGLTQQFDGDAAIDRILTRIEGGGTVPRAAKLVVEKLWLEFIGTTPDAAKVDTLATLFYAGGGVGAWELKPLLKAFFTDPAFTSSAVYGTMIKAPLELIGGFYRSLGLAPGGDHWDWRVYDSGGEDQNPLCPPNVKGWLGGTAWVNAKTLVERFGHMTNYGWDSDELVPPAIQDGYEAFMLAVPRIFPAPAPGWDGFRTQFRELIKDPAYQMK
jgi:uncharacterized protein (DUF1800 family)